MTARNVSSILERVSSWSVSEEISVVMISHALIDFKSDIRSRPAISFVLVNQLKIDRNMIKRLRAFAYDS